MEQPTVDLLGLEKRAFEASRAGDFAAAAALWEELLLLEPRWEFGYAHYDLARCYEELGRLDDAEAAYRAAIALAPEDTLFVDTLYGLVNARKAGFI